MRVYRITELCTATASLLISRKWKRKCCAIGVTRDVWGGTTAIASVVVKTVETKTFHRKFTFRRTRTNEQKYYLQNKSESTYGALQKDQWFNARETFMKLNLQCAEVPLQELLLLWKITGTVNVMKTSSTPSQWVKSHVVLCVLARQFGITITERKLPVTRNQEEEWKFYGKIQLSEIRCTCEYYSHTHTLYT